MTARTALTALVVRGGWDGHCPVDATNLFVPFLEEHGFEVRIEESNEVYADEPLMRCTDLVVQSLTMSEVSPEAFRGLAAAVRQGAGLAGWHGGIADSYRASSDYLQLIGGQFATHPSKDPALCVGDETDNFLPHTVHVTDLGRAHEITAGVEDFTLTTGAVLGAARRPHRRPGDHDASGSAVPPVAPPDHLPGRVDPAVG
jgi:type 1 glutamine amidotransferase